jgi:hypothetical protein
MAYNGFQTQTMRAPQAMGGLRSFQLQSMSLRKKSTGFSPASIPSVKAWYDAQDVSKLQLDASNNVISWTPSVGLVALAVLAGTAPTWAANKFGAGLAGLEAVGAMNFGTAGDTGAPGPGQDFFMLTAFEHTPASNLDGLVRQFITQGESGVNNGGRDWYAFASAPNWQFEVSANPGGSGGLPLSSIPLSLWGITNPGSGVNSVGWRNAQVQTTFSGSSSTGSRTKLNVGQNVAGQSLIGRFADIIIAGSLTSLEQAQLEGYVAWKYGLQALLPSNHAYFLAPP